MRLLHTLIPVSLLIGCGPGERQGGPNAGATDASTPADVRVDSAPVVPPVDAAPCGQVLVTYRDFMASHPDMQDGVGTDLGIVQTMLGPQDKPIFAPSGPTQTVTGAASFNQWYRDVPGVNMSMTAVLPLVENPPGTFTYDNQS